MVVGQLWGELNADQRAPYVELWKVDKERHREEKMVYDEKKRKEKEGDPSATEHNKKQKIGTNPGSTFTSALSSTVPKPPPKPNATTVTTSTPALSKPSIGFTASTVAGKKSTVNDAGKAIKLSAALLIKQEPETPLSKLTEVDDSRNSRLLRIALDYELPSDTNVDADATDSRLEFLEGLTAITFTDEVKDSGLRRLVKKLRKHASLQETANKVLTYWHIDLESQHWKTALKLLSTPSQALGQLKKVEGKLKSLCMYLQQHQCLSPELEERVKLRQLVIETKPLIADPAAVHYLQELETMIPALINPTSMEWVVHEYSADL